MKIPLIQIGSALLYASAGFCAFLMLLNRVLILMPDSKAKAPAILATFAVCVGVWAIPGFFLARPPWIFAPLVLLTLIVIGEARRSLIRHSCAGSSPVDTIPHQFNLTTPVTTTDLVVHRYQLPHPKWRGAPLRIVHLTDLHVHPSIPLEYYRLSESSADIVFSGHYHAGQIRAPILGPIVVPSVYGRRFDHGHFVVNGTHLFVASGIGAGNPPVRIYCQPDIFIVDLTREKDG